MDHGLGTAHTWLCAGNPSSLGSFGTGPDVTPRSGARSRPTGVSDALANSLNQQPSATCCADGWPSGTAGWCARQRTPAPPSPRTLRIMRAVNAPTGVHRRAKRRRRADSAARENADRAALPKIVNSAFAGFDVQLDGLFGSSNEIGKMIRFRSWALRNTELARMRKSPRAVDRICPIISPSRMP